MLYAVIWSQLALDQLTEIWLAAKDRAAVTAATHAIDARLANDPMNQGLPVLGPLRELHVSPLRVLFGINDVQRRVLIVRVTTDNPLANLASPNGQAPPSG
jgi:hypothetical protein